MILGRLRQTVPISGELKGGWSNRITYNDFTWSDLYSATIRTSVELNGYTGTGNSPLGVYAGFTTSIDLYPDTVMVPTHSILDVDCTVTYHYVVPEPCSLIMFAVGGIALLRKRKRI